VDPVLGKSIEDDAGAGTVRQGICETRHQLGAYVPRLEQASVIASPLESRVQRDIEFSVECFAK
jgi:hypothetical protein